MIVGQNSARNRAIAKERRTGRRSAWFAASLTSLALLGAFSVFLINGRGLFYFDTGGYLDAGRGVLHLVEQAPARSDATRLADSAKVSIPDLIRVDIVADKATSIPAIPSGTAPAKEDHRTIGSRSAIYGVVLSLFQATGWLDGVVVLNVAALWFALFLTASVIVRERQLMVRPSMVVASLILAGCAGSLPFYTAFLMPDILAPILILMIAVLAGHFWSMHRWEISAAIFLCILAVLAHPSHLLIAILLSGVGFFISPVGSRQKLRLAGLLAVLVIGVGVAERLAFTRIVEDMRGSSVFYLPFLTARLIDDGPGMDYLQDNCPNPQMKTCDLYAKLLPWDRNAARFDAPVIVFSTSPEFGSYRLLPIETQTAVSNDQLDFAMKVVLAKPLPLLFAIVSNTYSQLLHSGIDMTIPTEAIISEEVTTTRLLDATYAFGRLTGPDRAWITVVEWIHAAIYLISLTGIIGIIAVNRFRGHLRCTPAALVILAGILINALICGAISEPADRYGARVMFLLPVVLGLLLWESRLGQVLSRKRIERHKSAP